MGVDSSGGVDISDGVNISDGVDSSDRVEIIRECIDRVHSLIGVY